MSLLPCFPGRVRQLFTHRGLLDPNASLYSTVRAITHRNRVLTAFSVAKDPKQALQALHQGIRDSGIVPADVQASYDANMKPGGRLFRWGHYLDTVARAVVDETPLHDGAQPDVDETDYAFSVKFLLYQRRNVARIAKQYIRNADQAHRAKLALVSQMYARFGEGEVQAASQRAVPGLPTDFLAMASLLIDQGKQELAGRLLNAACELQVLNHFEQSGSL
jgi:hypothetical protein